MTQTKRPRVTQRPRQDVLYLAAHDCAAALSISRSKWYCMVRLKQAPSPVIRGNRLTRWSKPEFDAWVPKFLELHQTDASATVIARAKRASSVAKTAKKATPCDPR